MFKIRWDGSFQQLWDFNHWVGDLSELFFASDGPRDVIFLLSDEGQRVLKVSLSDGRVLEDIHPSGGGKDPEGLTFSPDGRLMVIISEPNEMAVYSVDGSCN